MLKLSISAQLVGLVCGLFATPCLASLYITNIPTEYYTITTAPGLTIYAGSTPNRDNCSGLGCDSCAGANVDFTTSGGSSYYGDSAVGSATTCSLKEVHPKDMLKLTVASTAPLPATKLYLKSTTSLLPLSDVAFTGDATEVSIRWAQLCDQMNYDSECNSSFAPTAFSIGWSSDGLTLNESVDVTLAYRYVRESPNWSTWCSPTFGGTFTSKMEGFCYFTAVAGDGLANVFPSFNKDDNFQVPDLQHYYSQGGADSSGFIYSGLAVFYSTDPKKFTTATPMQVLDWNQATMGLQQNTVVGLNNGTPYYFAIASVDQAGILSFFSNIAEENFSTDTPARSASQAVIPHK